MTMIDSSADLFEQFARIAVATEKDELRAGARHQVKRMRRLGAHRPHVVREHNRVGKRRAL